MSARIRINKAGGNYFAAEPNMAFIRTGCKPLDMILGGGWAQNRVANIIGDKSTGKTLLCIEACANFARAFPDGKIKYMESEAAFDPPYAEALGMPLNRVDFGAGNPLLTVEDFFDDLSDIYRKSTVDEPYLYILDSLDALSDKSEMDRGIDDSSYGASKAKKLSELFRRSIKKMSMANVTLIIVSQIRDKIGVTFGKKTMRSGGHSLDFYASQIISLAHIQQVTKTKHGIKRVVGVRIRAKVDKNKVGLAHREAEFEIKFGFGVDDVRACVDWLHENKGLDRVGLSKIDITKYVADIDKGRLDYNAELRRLQTAVRKHYREIETSFLPTRRKYE